MNSLMLHGGDDHRRTYAFVFEPGEDPIAMLTRAARDLRLAGSQITGIGGFSRATLGYFERQRRTCLKIPVAEQVEVLSLIGDLAHHEGEPVVHVHCVLGLRDGTTRGGHLLDAAVWPTLEVIVTEWPAYLCKRFDPAIGLALIESRRDTT